MEAPVRPRLRPLAAFCKMALQQGRKVADNAIAAAVVGGANLVGGVGAAFGAPIGSAPIEAIRNGPGLLGDNAFWRDAFVGAFVILAARSTASEVSVRRNTPMRRRRQADTIRASQGLIVDRGQPVAPPRSSLRRADVVRRGVGRLAAGSTFG